MDGRSSSGGVLNEGVMKCVKSYHVEGAEVVEMNCNLVGHRNFHNPDNRLHDLVLERWARTVKSLEN